MEITREEFYQAVGDLKADLRLDIGEVKNRLDTLNNRTIKNEVTIAEIRVRVETTEKDVLQIRRDDTEDAALAVIRQRRNRREGLGEAWAESATATVTKREKALIGLGLVALTFALQVLQFLGSKLWELTTVHKP